MIRTSVLAVVLLAASISDVLADDPPPRKPGLWEVASGHKGEAPTVARMCFDAASEAKMNKMADETLAVGCTRHESHLSGNVLGRVLI